DAAGRRLYAADEPAVDPHRAGFEVARKGQRPGNVLAVHAGHQAVAEPISHRQRLVGGVEFHRYCNRAEDFLARQLSSRVDTVEDGRLDEIAAVEPVWAAASQPQLRAGAPSGVEVRGNLFILLFGNQRAQVAIIETAPDRELRGACCKLLDELGADRA